MQCPECRTGMQALSTRQRKDGKKRRRYECKNGHRFTHVGTPEDLRISPVLRKEKEQSIYAP